MCFKNLLISTLVAGLLISALVAGALPQLAAGKSPTPGWQWPTAKPATVGLDETVLAALDGDIAAGKFGYVDSLLIIRHGKLAYERSYHNDYEKIYGAYGAQANEPSALSAHDPTGSYNYFNTWWHPYYRDQGTLHSLQSATKTVTSVVIGVAVTRGEFPGIDTPALQFFKAIDVANIDDRKRRMTLRHLLTMTSGLDWDESLP